MNNPKSYEPDSREHWHSQALYQNRRKNVWKARCYASWGAVGILLVGWLAFWLGTRSAQQSPERDRPEQFISHPVRVEEVSGPNFVRSASEDSAPEMLSSVWFNGCGGTVVSKGEKVARIISCGHANFQVGQQYTCYFPPRVNGRWRAQCNARCIRSTGGGSGGDLSELICDASFVSEVSPVVEELAPHDEDGLPVLYTVCGYPGGAGPKRNQLVGDQKFLRSVVIDERHGPMWRWELTCADGNCWYGSSGCGVFVNGALMGVESHIDQANSGKTFDCCPHEQLVKFVRSSTRTDCGNGFCRLPRRQRMLNGQQNQNTDAAPAPGAPATPPVPAPYDGHGPRPCDLNTVREMAAAIDLMRKELTDLKLQLAQLEPKSGKDGAPGATGPKGESGPAGASADMAAVQKMIDVAIANLQANQPNAQISLTQLQQAIAAELAKQPKPRDGTNGKDGQPGQPGVVTVRLIDSATGKVIKEAQNVQSGSVVPLTKTHFKIAPPATATP